MHYSLYIVMPLFWLMLIIGFLYSPYTDRLISPYRRSISIFIWSDIIDSEIISDFEEETGIKVYVSYYEGNDEMLTKLQFSGGAGYDLIMPTHYMIKPLLKRGFLKKIDKRQLNFWHDMDSHLLNLYFDPKNDYSIPYVWDFYGLGIDREFFADKKINHSWQMLFDPQYKYRVGMTDEPREVIDIASQYLFGTVERLKVGQPTRVKNLLLKQKRFVEAYTDLTLDFLLTSKSCPVVLVPTTSLYRARQRVDWAEFLLPKEGSIIAIENFVIAEKSTKEDMVYEFLNYVFKKNAIKKTYDAYGYLPPLKSLLYTLDFNYLGIDLDYFFGDYYKRVALIKSLLPRKKLYALWLSVKA